MRKKFGIFVGISIVSVVAYGLFKNRKPLTKEQRICKIFGHKIPKPQTHGSCRRCGNMGRRRPFIFF